MKTSAVAGLVRLTVAITVKDDRARLEALLASLASGDRVPDELVVVDAGSTDGSREAAEAWSKSVPFPVRVVVEPGSRGRGRQRCVEVARGDVVCFIDSDCEAPPDWLERYARAWSEARAHGEHTGALGGANRTPSRSTPFQHAVDDVMGEMEARSFHGINTINCTYGREALLEAGGFRDMQTAEDPDLNARIARRGYVLRRIDNPVAHERRRTWRALLRQHFAYGEGAAELLRRYPEYFPALERWIAPTGAACAAVLLAFAVLVHWAWAVALLGLLGLVPLVVHRAFVARFWRTHGASQAFARRIGVLWAVYAPYELGLLVARLRGGRPA